MQINMLILHCLPGSFDKHIVPSCALTIHADSNVVILEILRKSLAGELAFLIGTHDFGLAICVGGFF